MVVVNVEGIVASYTTDAATLVSSSTSVRCSPTDICVSTAHVLLVSPSKLFLFKLSALDNSPVTMNLRFDAHSSIFSQPLNAFVVIGASAAAVVTTDGKLKTVEFQEHSVVVPSPYGSHLVIISKDRSSVNIAGLTKSPWTNIAIDLVPGSSVEAAAFTSDGSVLAVVTSGDDAVTIYNPETGAPLASCATPVIHQFLKCSDPDLLAGLNTDSQQLCIWKIEDKNIERMYTTQVPKTRFQWLDKDKHVVSIIQKQHKLDVVISRPQNGTEVCTQEVAMDFPLVNAQPVSLSDEIVCTPSCGVSTYKPLTLQILAPLEEHYTQPHHTARSSIGDITLAVPYDVTTDKSRNMKRSSMCAIL